jgi:hypothetical protein
MIEYPRIAAGKNNVHNNMSWKIKQILVKNNSMVKDLLFKHGGERRWRVQTFTSTP